MRFQSFSFEHYDFSPDTGELHFAYQLKGAETIPFTETITLPSNWEYAAYDEALLNRALFATHLMLGISYYKSFCPKQIEIHSGSLNEEQSTFWNTVYTHGLGEFFYEHEIDFRGLIQFPTTGHRVPSEAALREAPLLKPIQRKTSGKSLLPLGGGKDSLTALALLAKQGKEFDLFTLRDNPIFQAAEQLTGHKRLILGRQIDPQLFSLNKQGAYNGHIPISACISFLSLVVSILYGYESVVFSNEASANEGNTELFGMEINHQWSKSLAFEQLFGNYVQQYITPDFQLFSLLRPYSEYKIVELFAQHPEYFSIFSSCNRNFHINKTKRRSSESLWCGCCPKCAFTFGLLAAFLDKETLLQIFGKNLFADEDLIPLFEELLGLRDIKPFECVGTPQEMEVAFWKAHALKYYEDTPVMQLFTKKVLPQHDAQYFLEKEKELLTPSTAHCIPDVFLQP